MATLRAFTGAQVVSAERLLRAKVAHMMGRKLEEGDWSEIYCRAKGIPVSTWSNLHLDVIHEGVGIEHKMLKITETRPVRDLCGTTMMHPAQTRSIRISSAEPDPNRAMRDVFAQYAELLRQRRHTVATRTGWCDELRSGWLLYQSSLREFLYFEEPLIAPVAEEYYAEWNERNASGQRKSSKNLWIYHRLTGQKFWSVTTDAGAKIQPYFEVPPPNDDNLHIFVAQGLHDAGVVHVWITLSTADALNHLLGNLDGNAIAAAIEEAEPNQSPDGITLEADSVVEIRLPEHAYHALHTKFTGVSDEHSFQLLVRRLHS